MSHCLVVGAGPGLGAAIARRFAAGGFTVSLVARHRETLDRVLANMPAGHVGYVGDAGNPDSLNSAIAAAVAAAGPIDVLAFNALSMTPGLPTALSEQMLTGDFRASVVGALTAAKAALPAMREAGRGTILLTGGGFALRPMAQLASVGISKAALRNLAFSLAEEAGPLGIHVATVTVGGIIKDGTPFAPDRVAEEFWQLHDQPSDVWETERLYRPEA